MPATDAFQKRRSGQCHCEKMAGKCEKCLFNGEDRCDSFQAICEQLLRKCRRAGFNFDQCDNTLEDFNMRVTRYECNEIREAIRKTRKHLYGRMALCSFKDCLIRIQRERRICVDLEMQRASDELNSDEAVCTEESIFILAKEEGVIDDGYIDIGKEFSLDGNIDHALANIELEEAVYAIQSAVFTKYGEQVGSDTLFLETLKRLRVSEKAKSLHKCIDLFLFIAEELQSDIDTKSVEMARKLGISFNNFRVQQHRCAEKFAVQLGPAEYWRDYLDAKLKARKRETFYSNWS